MTTNKHIDSVALALYSAGYANLTRNAALYIGEHLDKCPQCRRQLAKLLQESMEAVEESATWIMPGRAEARENAELYESDRESGAELLAQTSPVPVVVAEEPPLDQDSGFAGEFSATGDDLIRDLATRVADMVGPQRYKVWFKGSTAFGLGGGFVNVQVPNPFVGAWIERYFVDAIRDAAAAVVGRPLDVTFTIDPALSGQVRKEQADLQVDYATSRPGQRARAQRKLGTPPPVPIGNRTFEDFVVGSSNRLAYTNAIGVVDEPASQLGPLLIHGGCGVGKTHLLQAICNRLKNRQPDRPFVYLSGEDFTNQYIFAVKSGELDAFRHRYRQIDVLVIDDVHFFSNKRGTQAEFLHTFNAIESAGKQLVMASDAHPKMISHLPESLISRLVSGMVVKIEPPDYETRVEVLRRRALKMNCDIPDSVVQYIAEHCQRNIRELEGALFKLIAVANVTNKPITLSLAVEGLRDLVQRTTSIVRLSDIESVVAIYFGLTPADLYTSRKSRSISLARGVAMYLARENTDLSFPEIGRLMGNKNHSTVLLAYRRIKKILDEGGTVQWQTSGSDVEKGLDVVLRELEEQLGTVDR